MTKIFNNHNINFQKRYRAIESLTQCRGECKIVQSLWRYFAVSCKAKIGLLYVPTIMLLSIYQSNMKMHVRKKPSMCLFVICISSLVRGLFKSLAHFLSGFLIFLLLNFNIHMYYRYKSNLRYTFCKYCPQVCDLIFSFY